MQTDVQQDDGSVLRAVAAWTVGLDDSAKTDFQDDSVAARAFSIELDDSVQADAGTVDMDSSVQAIAARAYRWTWRLGKNAYRVRARVKYFETFDDSSE